jgi:putative glutamine amidotransferase
MFDGRPLVGLTARRLAEGRVTGWQSAGSGERAGYMERVRAAGGLPVLLDPAPGAASDAEALVARLDALVLTGGPDVEPTRYGQVAHGSVYGTDEHVDGFEMAITRAALTARLPLLAICRGIQVLNVVCGGTLFQHIPDRPGVEPHGRPGERNGERAQRIEIVAGSRLARVMGTTAPVCSCHHHQAVDQVGEGLRVVGRAADGVIEAIESTDPGMPVLAVQWHPEDTAANDPAQQALFDAVVADARAVHQR